MTEQRQDPPQSSEPLSLSPEQVTAYLHAHPEFFVDRDELLGEMRIPHQPGDAVSLVERQVRLLRERNIEMRHRLSQLMDVARDNDRLFDKTRRLVLDLLDASSLEEVVSCVEDSLRSEFQVPFVSLILFSDAALPVGRSVSSAEAHQAIGGLLAGGKTICGVLREHELSFLFGAEGAQVGSAAVVAAALAVVLPAGGPGHQLGQLGGFLDRAEHAHHDVA